MSMTAHRRSAFTLVELIVVIVVLAILSGVAIPKYFDYAARARESACKATLGAVRSAVANYYSNQLVTLGTGTYPSLQQLDTTGTVLQEVIPANPFNNSATISAATYSVSAPPTAGNAGWNYDVSSGKFWANTNTTGIAENTW